MAPFKSGFLSILRPDVTFTLPAHGPPGFYDNSLSKLHGSFLQMLLI
jgi:hypothetical protein